MSYCRFLEADAYIYDDSHYGLYCCACSLSNVRIQYSEFLHVPVYDGFSCDHDYDKMLDHIAKHRENGDHIPKDVDERLIFERDCNHECNSEGICKHCWSKKDAI